MKALLRNKLKISSRIISASKGPLSASLFITRKCNLECPYCRTIGHPWKDLNTAEWIEVINKLYSWGVRLFSITGGEPMIRKDIYEIIAHISHTRKAIPWLTSNFTTMTREKINRLADAGLLILVSSLDSLSEIGVKSDSGVLDLLEYAKSRGILCSTISVIHRDNISEIPAIMEEVTGRGIIFDIGLYQHVGGLFSSPGLDLKVQDIARIEELRKIIRRQKLKTGLVAPSWKFLKSDLQMYSEMSWKCPAQKDAFLVINNDGRLMPCQEFVSSVNVLDIDNLWDHRWRQQKAAIVKTCSGCYYGCYYQKVHMSPVDVLLDLYTMLKV